jgi:hypothetical protein
VEHEHPVLDDQPASISRLNPSEYKGIELTQWSRNATVGAFLKWETKVLTDAPALLVKNSNKGVVLRATTAALNRSGIKIKRCLILTLQKEYMEF